MKFVLVLNIFYITGTIFRLKGSILTMCFLDWTGALIKNNFESWRDAQKEKKDRECKTLTLQMMTIS